jgi:hypothetical protein
MTGLTVLDFDVGGPGFRRIYWADDAAKCRQRIRVLGSADSVTKEKPLPYPLLFVSTRQCGWWLRRTPNLKSQSKLYR